MTTTSTIIDSPIGPLFLEATDSALTQIDHCSEKNSSETEHPILRDTIAQLHLYFSGKLKNFDIPLAPHGTAFQLSVWDALTQIPYGETCSYTDIASTIARPKAVRAVGAANGKNPISIIIPCHRVIGKNGKLTGYAGGLDRKNILLSLEMKNFGGSS